MADKLKQSIAVVPEFVDGEQPTAAKLNSMGAQLRRAVQQLEKAVGDIHGESWPYLGTSTTRLALEWGRANTAPIGLGGAAERAPDIANIARLIGPASNLNPRMLEGGTITEDVPVGVHEFSLRYRISGTVSDTNPTFSDTVTAFVTRKTSKTALTTAGDYFVDPLGVVYTATATVISTATYTTDPRTWGGGINYTNARFNVIPDPNQITSGGTGLTFGAKDVQGRYPVTLPTASHQQSNIEGTSVALDADDVNNGQQLRVPKVLTNNLVAGDRIPDGFMVLKNVTTNEVFEDAEYYYDTNSTILVGGIDIDDAITALNDFVLVTVGTDITSSIDDLRVKSFHSHDRSHGEPFVSLSGITGFLEQPSNTGLFVPSEIPGNFAPQYLHRDGYNSLYDGNLSDANALRGPLLLGNSAGTPGSYVDPGAIPVASATHGVAFGHEDTKVFRNAAGEIEINTGVGTRGTRIVQKALLDKGFKTTEDFAGSGSLNANSLLKTWAYETNATFTPGTPFNWGSTEIPAAIKSGTILGWHFLLRLVSDSPATWWAPSGLRTDEAQRHYHVYYNESTQFRITLAGSDWVSGGANLQMRVLLWYV